MNSLFLRGNQLRTLPEEIFHGLEPLRQLLLDNNRLTFLPPGIFHGLYLQNLGIYENFQLLFFTKRNSLEFLSFSREGGNVPLLLEMIRDFFNYECQSSFAGFYQFAAGNSSAEAVRESFSGLSDSIKNALFQCVWRETGTSATFDRQWGESHAFDDMQIFYRALEKFVLRSFQGLTRDEKNVVYGHVCQLAQRETQTKAVDFSDPGWGKDHAFDNVLRLIDAMMLLSLSSREPARSVTEPDNDFPDWELL